MRTTRPDFLNDLQRVKEQATLSVLEKEQIKQALISTMQAPPEESIPFTIATDKPSPAGTAS